MPAGVLPYPGGKKRKPKSPSGRKLPKRPPTGDPKQNRRGKRK